MEDSNALQDTTASEHADNPYCKVTYLYRDAANFKCWGSFVVKGSLCLDDLTAHMIDREFFVPELIGVPPLCPEFKTEIDHDYHEVNLIEPSPAAPYAFTAEELIERMRQRSEVEWQS